MRKFYKHLKFCDVKQNFKDQDELSLSKNFRCFLNISINFGEEQLGKLNGYIEY